MADRGRGGYRQPARPAAVSNPQSGARTDGGAGSKSQPIRVPTGGAYGDAKALREQQQGAPLAVGGRDDGSVAQVSASGPGGDGGPGVPPIASDLFRPTERPGEQMPALPVPQQAPEADVVLRQLVKAYPSPWLLRMLQSQ